MTLTPRYSPSGPPLVVSGGPAVVQSYYNPDDLDMTTDPAINGVFYAVPVGGEGWYRLQATFNTVNALQIGVDGVLVRAYIGAVDGDHLMTEFTLTSGGEGTQARINCTPADLYLKEGQSLFLNSSGTPHMIVAIQLLLIGLAADL